MCAHIWIFPLGYNADSIAELVCEDGKAAFCVYTYEQPNDRESVISQSFRILRTVLDM